MCQQTQPSLRLASARLGPRRAGRATRRRARHAPGQLLEVGSTRYGTRDEQQGRSTAVADAVAERAPQPAQAARAAARCARREEAGAGGATR